MLDLQPRVHLHEIELAGGIEQELDRAGAHIVHRLGQRDRGAAPIRSRKAASTAGEGDLLDQLLVPPLHRAVALAEMHDIAVLVGEHLHLDVARAWSARVRAAAARRRRRAAPPSAPHRARRQARFRRDQPHAASAAAGRRLDHQRKADSRCGRGGQRGIALVVRLGARNGRHAGARARCASPPALSPICRIAAGGGPTQVSPASITALREIRVLGEEAVARMHRVGAGLPAPPR